MASQPITGVGATPNVLRAGVATARAVRTGAQPSISPRVAISIVRIPDGGDLDIPPIPVQFTQDLADTLGDYGTQHDGWESLLTDMELSIGDDATGLDSALSLLDDIGPVDFDAFQATTFDPITGDMAGFQATGDNLLNTFTTDATPPPPPPPPPPPTPPGGNPCAKVDCDANPDDPCCSQLFN